MNSVFDKIESIISDINNKKEFSGVVLVKEKDNIIFEKSYGLANRNEEIKNKVDTKFGVASGAKGFTAVAICQLVQRGLISFDTLLKDCLDIDFPKFDSNITIHHLLTHSSGIPDYFDEEVMSDYSALWNSMPMYNICEVKDFLPMFKNRAMEFKPGYKFKYNNAGFIVLGLIIEKLTGLKFAEYIENNIFKICKMNDSGYFFMDNLPKNTAYGYIENHENNSWKTNIYSIPIVGGPDGGVFTTASDMTKFWSELFNNRLLNKELTEKILSTQIVVEKDLYYGYGIWIVQNKDGIFKYTLMGADPGVSFRSSVYPKHNINLTVMANKEYGGSIITREFENKVLKDY
ncbi:MULTISPECIES: serine hydrolase domain-containing protein [unclassified Clostridium]|uniref:serine hydrolase domain-containing protein n=1 Tax=unclassified Clostridium TaxID=2614128 RepID=UPI0025BC14B1|nr:MULTISPECIES: serine hydrolase domain-containing protein [unclassified Clostridium]